MILKIEAPNTELAASAHERLQALGIDWDTGVEIIQPEDQEPGIPKVDPISIAALIVSIPAAALAVGDLIDRARKRKRAEALIGEAESLQQTNVNVYIIRTDGPVLIAQSNPDQLLELAQENPDQA